MPVAAAAPSTRKGDGERTAAIPGRVFVNTSPYAQNGANWYNRRGKRGGRCRGRDADHVRGGEPFERLRPVGREPAVRTRLSVRLPVGLTVRFPVGFPVPISQPAC
ncbi:hypothetical protein Raf01_40370 [Rugosimonospora africana]|uniref:Uncharacterized protein n=1 Tax=Rugosimonospora africana TaxID=556532 RepID=A0A8J3VR68_9ACTN|nr:hypothetical protein Raf01_40370 [Rugosimonospora africana]